MTPADKARFVESVRAVAEAGELRPGIKFAPTTRRTLRGGRRTMKVREKMVGMLEDRGLFPAQAKAVLDSLRGKEHAEAVVNIYENEAEPYLPVVLLASWITVAGAAVDWIDREAPEHWARAIFASDSAPTES